MVELDEVSIAYRVAGGSLMAVEGAQALFPAGSLCALVGPSGSGKTTLLQAMAGLLPLAGGKIRIGGKDAAGVRERTAIIFQDSGLLPWKTVRDNAELALTLRKIPRRERRRRVDPILEELGLLEWASFYPARLSGGMRQRLGVARALAQEADLLLMDEPFSSLDALTRESLQDSLLELRAKHPMTIILVTHSIEEAAYLADIVFVIAGKAPGRLTASLDWRGGDSGQPGEMGFRTSPAYFKRCAELRLLFETEVASAARGVPM
jgi:NitT/TauT family transport system ATP-binding protein